MSTEQKGNLTRGWLDWSAAEPVLNDLEVAEVKLTASLQRRFRSAEAERKFRVRQFRKFGREFGAAEGVVGGLSSVIDIASRVAGEVDEKEALAHGFASTTSRLWGGLQIFDNLSKRARNRMIASDKKLIKEYILERVAPIKSLSNFC